jgi:hypothetical protein
METTIHLPSPSSLYPLQSQSVMKRLTPESAKKLKDLGNKAVGLRFNRVKSLAEVVYQGVEAEYAWGEEICGLFFEDYFKPYAEIMSSSWRDADSNEHRYKIHIRKGQFMRIPLSR